MGTQKARDAMKTYVRFSFGPNNCALKTSKINWMPHGHTYRHRSEGVCNGSKVSHLAKAHGIESLSAFMLQSEINFDG